MPVELQNEAAGDVLVVRLTGKLISSDYAQLTRDLERRISEKGKIRMLVEMHDFHGWTAGALWEDLKFDVKHFNDIERLALVGEKKWEHGMAVFCKPFTTAKVRYFDRSEMAAAEEWIQEGLPA
jgi:hypothetical protein